LEPVPLDEPVPEAPMLELELGDDELDELGDVELGELLLLDELLDGEAPIVDDEGEVDDDDDGEVLLLPDVLGVVGVLLLVPVPLPLVEAEPPLLPADVPAPPAAPPVWATA
ncbi:MAG: hypothetical protein ACJ8GO_06145, partial [Ramlibacter sp.]